MKKFILFGLLFLLPVVSSAAISYSESINLSSGWNIVSTPRVLESHSFSIPETSNNFDVFILNASSTAGWSTLADLGQTEFTPLFGYFINNKSTSTQTLTFNYKASTTPNQRLFERTFTKTGWYSFGISNPTYAKATTDDTSDINNPSKILSSIFGSYDSVIDLTEGLYFSSVSVGNNWKQAVASDIDSLSDLRDGKGYVTYIKQTNALYSGFQNDGIPEVSVLITADGHTASTTVSASSTVEIAWTSSNASSCDVSPENWSGTNGIKNILVSTTTTYSVSCLGVYGGAATSSIKVNTVSASINVSLDNTLSSGSVIAGTSNVPLARYIFEASGEDMKISYLQVSTSHVGGLRNVSLYANDTQVGSTQTISTIDEAKLFNLGSSLKISAGQSVTVEIRGDVNNADGTNATTTGENTIVVALSGFPNNTQSSYSLQLSTVPDSIMTGPTMTVVAGELSLSKSSGYTNKSVVAPQTAYKLGEYVLMTNNVEGLNLNSLSIFFDGASASSTIGNISDVYVVYGTKQTSSKSSVVAGSNTYSLNENVPASSSINITVYGTISSLSGASDIYNTQLAVSGQTVQSGQTVSSAIVTGQTVAVTTGSLAVTKDASSPATDLIAAGTGATAKVASFKFEAQNDDYTITDLAVGVAAASAGNVSSFTLKNGSTIVKENQSLDSVGVATSTGVSFVIPAGTSKILDVYANLSAIGTNNATTSSNIQTTLTYFKKQSSTGVQTEVSSTATTSNAMYVFKSKPTVTVASLPSTLLANGTKTLAKFNVRADAAGSIAWGEVSIAVSKTVGRAALTNIKLYDDATGIEVAGAFSNATTTLQATSSASATLVFTPTAEEQVGAGATKTYSLKATVAIDGELLAGNNVTTAISSTGGAAASTVLGSVGTSSFKWSDMSVSGHSTATADWNTDYLVKDMASLDTQSISY